MKQILILSFVLLLFNACKNTPSGDALTAAMPETNGKTIVYYFHGKLRCVTCTTLQEVAYSTISEQFADNPDVVFHEVDFSDPANKALAEKYEIVFSSLVIARDENFVDLTDEAFMLVMRQPEVLKQRITEETQKLAAL
jgi:hypothetical protein